MSDALRKEIIGIALLGLFLFVLVSLLSYHPFDPSPNSATSEAVRNFCGRAGSYTADFLVQYFGWHELRCWPASSSSSPCSP